MKNIPKKALRRGKQWLNADTMSVLEQLKVETQALRRRIDDIDGRLVNAGNMTISESEVVAKLFSGLKMYLDPRDLAVVPHLVLDTIWEPHITRAWLSVVGDSGTVLDIGANFGYYGALAAQKMSDKSSRVVYFEANPHLIPYIRKTVGVNWITDKSIIENLAVADKTGKVQLTILKDYIGSSSLHSADRIREYMGDKMYVETSEKVTVDAVTVDDYCARNSIGSVDVIKMDIEGYEDKAYKGMRNIVSQSPNLSLFLEFTKGGYKSPERFYGQLLQDFAYIYLIQDDGSIRKADNTDYEYIIGATDDWVMPILSQRSDLAAA